MNIELNPFYEECSNELKKNLKEFKYGEIETDSHTKDEYKICFDRRLFCFGCDEERHGKLTNIEEILKIGETTYNYDSQFCKGCSEVYKKLKPLLPPIVYTLSHEGIIEFKIPKAIFSCYVSYLKEFYEDYDKDDETVILSCTDGGEVSCDNLIFKLMIIKKTEEITRLFWVDINKKNINKTKVDWKKLSPSDFEEFCSYILRNENFKKIKWYGKGGGDKGRDLTAEKSSGCKRGKQVTSKWIVSCKRYTQDPPSKTILYDDIVKAEEFEIDDYLFIITNTLTSGTKDWLKAQKKKHKFTIHVWEEIDLKQYLFSDKKLLLRYFPELYNPPVSSPRHGIFIDHFFNKFKEVQKTIKKDIINNIITHQKRSNPSFSEKDIIEKKLPMLYFKISSSWFKYGNHDRVTDFSEFKEKIVYPLELFYEQSIEAVPQCKDIGAMLERMIKNKYKIEITFDPMFIAESDITYKMCIFNTLEPPYYNFEIERNKKN